MTRADQNTVIALPAENARLVALLESYGIEWRSALKQDRSSPITAEIEVSKPSRSLRGKRYRRVPLPTRQRNGEDTPGKLEMARGY